MHSSNTQIKGVNTQVTIIKPMLQAKEVYYHFPIKDHRGKMDFKNHIMGNSK